MLEDDLTRLLESHVSSARDCQLVRRVLGWDGQRGCGLKDAGDELGITRERARQVYDRAVERIRDSTPSPALDAAISLVNRTCNSEDEDVEAELQQRGLTRYRFPIRSLLKTAQIFGRVPEFTVEQAGGKMFVVARAGAVQSIIKAALRSSTCRGIQTVSALSSSLPAIHRRRSGCAFIRQVLNTRRDIRWLDDSETTFWLASVPRNPVVRCLKKVMCYASLVELSDIHRAIGRLPAKQRGTLSRALLTKFCEQVPFCRVVNGSVERVGPLSAGNLISDAERIVCGMLRRNGNQLPVRRLQSLCASMGVQKPNLWRIMLHSPLIFRPAPRTYGVITASANSMETIQRRPAVRATSRSAEDRVRLHCTQTP